MIVYSDPINEILFEIKFLFFDKWILIRVKYIFASCTLRTLFFALLVLFCTKIGTCGMRKDGNGTSV